LNAGRGEDRINSAPPQPTMLTAIVSIASDTGANV
jgi:hypothetical protein